MHLSGRAPSDQRAQIKTRVVCRKFSAGADKTLGHMSGNSAGGALGVRPLNLKQQGGIPVYPAKLPLEPKHIFKPKTMEDAFSSH